MEIYIKESKMPLFGWKDNNLLGTIFSLVSRYLFMDVKFEHLATTCRLRLIYNSIKMH